MSADRPASPSETVNSQASAAADTTISELQRREKDLSDFIETAAVALHWVGEDGTILWVNEAELKLLGYSREEYASHNIAEFHADAPVCDDILRRLKNDEKLSGYEARLRCKDGSIRHVAISSSVYREHGVFVHTRCVTLDITPQKRAAELQEHLAAIVESSDDAIISTDLGGMILSWNAGAARLFSYTAEEAIGKHISLLAFPDRLNEIPEILGRVARGERIAHYETERRTKDGKSVTVSLTVSPIRNTSGEIIAASEVARDVSANARSTELQERLAAIVESSDDAIVSKDLKGIIRSWNAAAERLFGYGAAEVIGQPITIIIPTERFGEEPEIIRRLQRGERVDHFETIRKRKDGTLLDVSLTISPVRNARGVIVGASKIARDISGHLRQEKALREANQALAQSNADLQQFAYSASHDLQEPLRMVATYSELLQREFGEKIGPSGEEYIGYTVHGALRMEHLLSDLRAYALASGGGQAPTEDVDAGQALDRALANLETAVKDTEATVTRNVLPRVRIHEVHLEQLFQNLIGNALRYRSTAPPRIHVEAERNSAQWLFSVKDNGIGIDPQYKEQVFGIFQRLHSAAQYPGTGMGLAICQRIVERAGGRIWVESAVGQGSTFFFTLPGGEK